MAVRVLFGFAVLLSLVWHGPSQAQNAQPPVPNPAALSADWWQFFVIDRKKDNGDLSGRIDRSDNNLVELETALAGKGNDELIDIVKSVRNQLERYRSVKSAKPVPLAPVVSSRQRYNVNELLDVIDRLSKARAGRTAAKDEISNLESAIENVEREYGRKKSAYLQLDKAAPQRLQEGLLLMQTRLQLEVARESLQRLTVQNRNRGEFISALEAELKTAAERLNATPDDIAVWRNKRQEALTTLARLKSRLHRTQLDNPLASTDLAPRKQAEAQAMRQNRVWLEVETGLQEAKAAQADLLVRHLVRTSDAKQGDLEQDRQALASLTDRLGDLAKRLTVWRRQIGQARTAVQRSSASERDPSIAALYEQRLGVISQIEESLPLVEEAVDVGSELSGLLNRLIGQQESGIEKSVWFARETFLTTWQAISNGVTMSLFEISETPVTALGLLRVLLILTIAWWLSKLVRQGLATVSARRETVSQSSVYTLGRILHYVILTIGTLVGLSSIGIDFTKFALFVSALGVGIGFGLQTLASNFVAGLIILFEKSLKIGDFVELESGVHGEVREINMRSTLITTNDNIDMLVPNSEFVNGRVTNWTLRESFRRIHVPFGVAYGTDKELVKKAALEAADAVSWTLKGHAKRKPQVWFVEFGDSSLNFELIVWLEPEAVKRPGAVQAAYLWEIESKLKQYEIEVPFPQRDLHVRSILGKKDEEGWPLFSADQ